MEVDFYGKFLQIDAKRVLAPWINFGLMFRNRNTENLWFDFGKKRKWEIHSWFCPKFLVLWISGNKVVSWGVVKPFRIVKCGRDCTGFVELPFNTKNKKIIDFIVGNEKV